MPTIDHSNILDLNALAATARECGEIIEDDEEDGEEIAESKDTLTKLAEFCHDFGYGYADSEDADSVASALESIDATIISEDHFEAYCQELVTDMGDLPSNLPDYISSNIDWEGVANDLRSDYSSVTLDGEDYLYR